MREIKFRGYSVDDDKWVYGFYVFDEFKGANGRAGIAVVDTPLGFELTTVHPKSVGQYTGLKDKSGTEIYEGDILYFKKTLKQPSGDLTHEVTGQVQYRKGMPQLDGKTKQMQGDEENEHESRSILLSPEIYKVIGNIFENPELIERQEARHD